MAFPYIIKIVSQSGGSGKTVIALNLAVALGMHKEKVLLIEGMLINASLKYQLNLDDSDTPSKKSTQGFENIKDSIKRYNAGNIDVLLGTPFAGSHQSAEQQARRIFEQISGFDYDFIIVDTPSGTPRFDESAKFNDTLVTLLPSEFSVKSNLALIQLYKDKDISYEFIVNRVGASKSEMSIKDIQEIYLKPAKMVIKEDGSVPKSQSKRLPAYLMDKNSQFAKSIDKLAKEYISKRKNR